MKKLLGIVILGLLLSSNASAVFYNFKDCVHGDNKIDHVTIDLENKIINSQWTLLPAVWNNLKEPLVKNAVSKMDRAEDRQWFFFWKNREIFGEIKSYDPSTSYAGKKWGQFSYNIKDKSLTNHLYWMDKVTYDALPPKLKDIKNLIPWINSLSRFKLKEEKIGKRKSKFSCKIVN